MPDDFHGVRVNVSDPAFGVATVRVPYPADLAAYDEETYGDGVAAGIAGLMRTLYPSEPA